MFLSLTFGHFHICFYNSVGAFCWFLSFILPLYKLGNAKFPQNSIVSDTEFPCFFYHRLGTIIPKKFAAATVFPPFSNVVRPPVLHLVHCGPHCGQASDRFCNIPWYYLLGTYLVDGLEHFLFSIIYGIILPIDFHIFQRGRSTTNQVYRWFTH